MEMPRINLPPIQTKYKILMAIGAVGLLLGFYLDHAYKPHAENIQELENGLAGLEDTITVIRNVEYPGVDNDQKILARIEGKKEQNMRGISKREEKLPMKTEYSKMLEKITHIASSSGFDIKTLEPKNFKVVEGYNSMSLEMLSSSRFTNLLNFLEELKPYQINLESIYVNIRERPVLMIRLNLSILAK